MSVITLIFNGLSISFFYFSFQFHTKGRCIKLKNTYTQPDNKIVKLCNKNILNFSKPTELFHSRYFEKLFKLSGKRYRSQQEGFQLVLAKQRVSLSCSTCLIVAKYIRALPYVRALLVYTLNNFLHLKNIYLISKSVLIGPHPQTVLLIKLFTDL